MKEGSGLDNLAVAWQGPGISRQVIPGAYLRAYAPQVLLSYWQLDETAGTTAQDSAGEQDGALTNGPTWQPAGGQIDGTLSFDGNNDYVDLGSFDAFSNAPKFTVSCWVNPARLPFATHEGIIGIGASDQRAPWVFGLQGASSLFLQFETVSGSAGDGTLQTADISQDQWTHVALTWDGSTCTSYINSVFDNSDTTTGNQLISSSGNGYLGRIDGYGYWNGMLDDIRVYNYPLASQEIIELYRQGRPGDLDRNGNVDLVDLQIFANQYPMVAGYTESAGQVIIETEHYRGNTPGSGALTDSYWTLITGSGSLGDGYMQVPDLSKSINTDIELYSPHLSYLINFGSMGYYYIWLKGNAAGGGSDSVHFGLDGVCFSSDSNSALKVSQGGSFTWFSQKGSGARPVVTIESGGLHTFDLWMREDGAALDRLVLTTNVGYDPTVSGNPTESAYQPELIADMNGDDYTDLADYNLFATQWIQGVN